MRILYREATDKFDFSERMNAGLWYDKFADQWNLEALLGRNDSSDPFDKPNWIAILEGHRIGSAELIREMTFRRRRMIRTLGGECDYYSTEGPFVTGLGRSHPVENGFAWHHTLGTAFLPGTSVKGMIRAWATSWRGIDEETCLRIFGSSSKFKPNPRQAGSVVFSEAIPVEPLRLKPDIMTPHYGPYYSDGETPGDWISPVPIPFLVVEERQTFQFAVYPRRSESDADQSDCETARNWLSQALENVGAGAKTATGYGRFVADKTVSDKIQARFSAREKQRQDEAAAQLQKLSLTQGKSPIAIELISAAISGKWSEDKSGFDRAIDTWLPKLEQDPQSDAVTYFSDLIEKHFPRLLANPHATKGKQNKSVFSERQIRIAERILAIKVPVSPSHR